MKTVNIYIKDEVREFPVCGNSAYVYYPENGKLPSEQSLFVEKFIDLYDNLILTTCSHDIVDYIGELVEQEKVSHVSSFVWFEGRKYFFDKEGYLIDWPYGCID